jgi:hypothetical protein
MQEGASELGKEKLAIHQKMIKLIPPLPRHLEGAVACLATPRPTLYYAAQHATERPETSA